MAIGLTNRHRIPAGPARRKPQLDMATRSGTSRSLIAGAMGVLDH